MKKYEQTSSSEKENEDKRWYKNPLLVNLILMVLILAAYMYYSDDRTGTEFDVSDTALTITFPDDSQYVISYEDLTSMELESDVDYGTLISGNSSKKSRYGTWENEKWGTYYLSVTTSVDSCIVIQSTEVTIVVNYESDAITEALYEQLLEYAGLS